MKKTLSLLIVILLVSLSACDTTLAVLQGMSNGLNDYNSVNSYNQTVTSSSYPTTTSSYSEKEWHDCSSCQGSGRCKYCNGSGKNEYTKNGRCGVCKGTGKCAGCNGRGGWKG